MNVETWLKNTTNILADNMFASPRLDAEIILAHTIQHPRTWLHAHGDSPIDLRQREIADARLDLRLDHVPIAYIIGHKEFYGRRFIVSPASLIPRPESEQLIELLNEYLPQSQALEIGNPKRLVDIGTGSGCLGITAKLEHPELQVTLLDTNKAALAVAEKNCRALQVDVQLMRSDLLNDYPYSPDIVLANLPYVDRSWSLQDELRHEPADALFAERNGVQIIQRCLKQLAVRLKPGAIAIFEADPRQWTEIDSMAQSESFKIDSAQDFARRYIKI